MTEAGPIPTLEPGAGVDQATKRELLAFLERDAQHLCARFGLRYRVLEAERANVKRRYGVCFSDGTIRIRLRHVATGKPLKYSSLVNTLCHELAHLRHFNHGPHFQALYAQILEFARRNGIYRPKAAIDAGRTSPTQAAVSTPGPAPRRSILPTRPGREGRDVPSRLVEPRVAGPAPARGERSSPAQLELFGSSVLSSDAGRSAARPLLRGCSDLR